MAPTTDLQDTTLGGFPAIAGAPETVAPGVPTVVFLHGAFADHEGFRGWVHRFAAAGYPAVAAARRGRLGVGPDRAEGATFADYVDDTLAVLDDLGVGDTPAEAPVLVGHSLGGLVAQRLAEMGRARALVLLASAPPAMLTAQAAALPHFAPNLGRIMTGRPFIVPPGACSALALNRVPDDARPAIHAHLTHESGRVYRSMMFGTVRVDRAKVTVPVWVGGGADDRIISTRLLRRTAHHYGVEPHVYADHAHWLLEEPGWEALADDVIAWLHAVGHP